MDSHGRGTARSVRDLFVCLLLGGGAGIAGPELQAITITELMYHPAGADIEAAGGANLEWIELYNETPVTLNLSGYFFSNGIDFVFPEDTYLDAYSYLVVCADENAVRAAYGIENVIGNFSGRLDNGGETIALNIFGGGPEVEMKYSDRGQWPHAADGTGHSLALKGVFLDPDNNDHWAPSVVMGGTPGRGNFDAPEVTETVLLEEDEVWRYRRGTSPYPPDWTHVGFDDSHWEIGQTGIGYEDGDDRTVLSDMQGSYLSFAARIRIQLTEKDLGAIDDLVLQISYDDGFVAYLNGVEAARGAMSGAESPAPFDAPADLHEAGAFEEFFLPANLLRVGENVLAVQVHNTTIESSDVSFVPRLLRRESVSHAPASESVPVVINELFARTEGPRWVELYNTSARAVDLAGFYLSDDRDVLDKWALPGGSVVPPRGFLSLSGEETGLDLAAETITLYLSRPALERVIDAQVFEDAPGLFGTSDARYPDGGPRFFVSTSPTPYGANEVNLETEIVLNELMYHPPGDRSHLEFIELLNRGAVDVDLSGFRFTRGVDYTFPPGSVLAAGEYVVVAKDPDALRSAYQITGVHGPYEGLFDNDGELVRLVDRLGNIVDEFRYSEGGTWDRWADGGGSSLELVDPRQDNSVGSAWAASDETDKAEWEEVTYTITDYVRQTESEIHIMLLAPGEVLLDEMTLHRFSQQMLPNPGFERDAEGWIIEGNHIRSHRTTEDSFGGDACLKIVATGDGDTRVNRIETETQPPMNTGGVYTLSCALRWQRGANLVYLGNYNQLPAFQFLHRLEYPMDLGSPGSRNSVRVDNSGPVVSEVMHHPAVPSGGQSVRVTARVSDGDGVDRVRAFYRIGSPEGLFSFVDLHDDGRHDDRAAGDGFYAGVIPAQPTGTRVVYYIDTRDEAGFRGRFPVDPDRTHVYLHDAPLSARSFTARLIHDDAAWEELWSRRLHSNELLDATFIFEESEVYYNVGSRFRGSPWNRPPDVRMYRVNFARDRRHRGLRAVNLSRYGNEHDERAAYYSVWRNSTPTIPCPMSRGSFARVKTNSRTDMMELVEPVNRDYARLWFPGDSKGTFYKVTGKLLFNDSGRRVDPMQWAAYEYLGPEVGEYRWFFNHRTNELENDFSPLIRMLEAVNGTDAELDDDLDKVMDVEQFLRVYAARCAHDDWDTIAVGNGQNAYFYWAPEEGRMKLVPWDMDHSWGNVDSRVYPDADPWFSRVISRPKWRRRYQAILSEMVSGRGAGPGYWSVEELVTKFVERNHAVVGADGVSSSSASKIRNFVDARRSRLAAQVPSVREFSILTNDGNAFAVDASRTELEGEAWVDVYAVALAEASPEESADPERLDLEWTSELRWRVEVPLEVGENELRLVAFDDHGRVVGSDSIAVTSTFGWRTPEITAVVPDVVRPAELVRIRGLEFHNGLTVIFEGTPSPLVTFDESIDAGTAEAEVPEIAPGRAGVVVVNVDGRASEPYWITVLPPLPRFVRGDLNLDGWVEIADAMKILAHLFRGVEVTCADAGDVDNDEVISMSDAVRLLDFLYGEGEPPDAPFPQPGRESTDEGPLGCEEGL